MREILFKAKRKDNGKWVEGYLYGIWEQRYICLGMTNDVPNMKEVIPETVSQYTGLTDRNGNRIWENDIVKYTYDSPDDPTATENGLIVRVGRIFWSAWRASFAVTAGENGSESLNQDIARYVRGRSIYEYVRGANTVKVIGNVFDNSDLLEGENGNT